MVKCLVTDLDGTLFDGHGPSLFDLTQRNREGLIKAKENGLTIAGTSPDGRLVEAVENDGCAFFVGVQYHPEFKSRPDRPHPLFKGFVTASLQKHIR